MNVEEEVERLKEEIKRLGKTQDDGSYKVGTPVFLTPFGFVFIFAKLTPFVLSKVLMLLDSTNLYLSYSSRQSNVLFRFNTFGIEAENLNYVLIDMVSGS